MPTGDLGGIFFEIMFTREEVDGTIPVIEAKGMTPPMGELCHLLSRSCTCVPFFDLVSAFIDATLMALKAFWGLAK